MSTFSHWSHSLRRTFVKDYDIPVSVVDDPYFEHQIRFLDKQYKTFEKVKLLEDSLAKYGSEDEFFIAMKKTRETIIDHIKGHPDYENFGSFGSILVPDSKERKTMQKSIYKVDFCDRDMISIDLVKANFQSYVQFLPDAINNKGSYEEFVQDFTDDEYFIRSKKIRQVIFGNLNPKKQMNIAQHMMWAMKHKINIYSTDFFALSADELVFELNDCYSFQGLVDYVDQIPENVRIQQFQIEKVPVKTSNIFVKRFPDGTFKLKCCPGNYVIEVLRHIYGETVHPWDIVFYNDGRLCEYKDSLFDK